MCTIPECEEDKQEGKGGCEGETSSHDLKISLLLESSSDGK